MGLVEFVREKNLENFSYFVSNRNCFFHRFADSGFKNKWTGLWKRERKFLEYFAIRIGNEWLSPANCKMMKYNFAKGIHLYKPDGEEIKEMVFIPEGGDSLVIEITSKRKMDMELELALNIRKRVENETGRKYFLKNQKKSLMVWNKLGKVSINILDGKFRFEKNPVYREHFPGGGKQNYFIPGRIFLRGKKIAIAISPFLKNEKIRYLRDYRKMLREKEECYRKLVKNKINSGDENLIRGFNSAILGTELLKKRINGLQCYCAGLPWFQQFWVRDVLWIVPSLVNLGYFNDVKNCLKYLASQSNKGIPNFISEAESSAKDSIDSVLLWIISLEYYILGSGDVQFLKRMENKLIKLVNFLFNRDVDLDGFIEHDLTANETWMDTLKRNTKAVEIESLYFKALNSAKNLLEILARDDKSEIILKILNERIGFMKTRFEGIFFSNGFYADRIYGSERIEIKTANALVPLLCGFRRHENEILNVIESDMFTTPVGIRSMALGKNFKNGYHTGMVWSLTTAWGCAAEFLANRSERGWDYMKMFFNDMERDALGSVGECWNSLSLEQKGCSLQLWGSAFAIRLIDEFMLGIKINALDECIYVNPRLPDEIKYIERELFVGKKRVKVGFRKRGGSVSVFCDDKKIKIIKKL